MTSAWYPRAWLTERGFDPDGDLGTSTLPSVPKRAPLYQAAQAGELSVCKWLHDHGATTVVQSASIQRGDSPLMVACSQGHLDVAKWLFSHGAEEDATRLDEHGSSPLYYACCGGHLDVVQWLVQRTSAAKYVRKRNAHGLAPIHGACLKSQLLVVEYLADHGAAGDLWNAKTQSLDHTALSVSAGNTEVMDWLHAKFKTAASPAQSARCPTPRVSVAIKKNPPVLSPDQANVKTSNPMLRRLSPKNTPPPLPQMQESPHFLSPNRLPLTSDFRNASSSVLTTARQSDDFLENQANELWLIPSNPQEQAARLFGLEANSHKVAGDIDAALKAYEEKLLVEHARDHGATHYMIGELHAFRASVAGHGGGGGGESTTDAELIKQDWVRAEASFARAAAADPSLFEHDSEFAYAKARVQAESALAAAPTTKEAHNSNTASPASPASATSPSTARNILQRSKSNEGDDNDTPRRSSSTGRRTSNSSSRKSVSKRAVNFLGLGAGASGGAAGASRRSSAQGNSTFLGLGGGQDGGAEEKPKGPAEKMRSALLERRSVWQFDFGSSEARKVDVGEERIEEEGKGGSEIEHQQSDAKHGDGASENTTLATTLSGGTLLLHGAHLPDNEGSSDEATPKESRAAAAVAAGIPVRGALSKQQPSKASKDSLAKSGEGASRKATLTLFSTDDNYEVAKASPRESNKQDGIKGSATGGHSIGKKTTSLEALQDQEVKRTVSNVITGSEPFEIKKASRYLGDQGSLVEFALNFAAPLPFKGNEPASSLASLSTTKVHFRGVVESSSPKVMTGCAYIRARQDQVAARQKAASAFSHFEQAFILSNLGDATFDLQAFLLAQNRARSGTSPNSDSSSSSGGADDTSSAANKGKPTRPPLGHRTSSQGRNASKLSLFGALGFSTYALRRSGSHSGSSVMRMPQPRSIDKESAMEDVVVDKEGMGWLKLGHFRANKQDFAFHSDDRLGVLRTMKYLRSNRGAAAVGSVPLRQPSITGNAVNHLNACPPQNAPHHNRLHLGPPHLTPPSPPTSAPKSPLRSSAASGRSNKEEAQACALQRWRERRSSKVQRLPAGNSGRSRVSLGREAQLGTTGAPSPLSSPQPGESTAITEAEAAPGSMDLERRSQQLDAALCVAQASRGFTFGAPRHLSNSTSALQ